MTKAVYAFFIMALVVMVIQIWYDNAWMKGLFAGFMAIAVTLVYLDTRKSRASQGKNSS